MDNLCFSSFVFGSYQKYIPYYIFSIARTYPGCFVKIFIETSLDDSIKKALRILRENRIENFEIVEMDTSFEGFIKCKMRGSGPKASIRWILGEEYFKGFEYVYIGDIDIMILPENESLLDLHKRQMDLLKLPFSNKVRSNPDGTCSGRLSGLHFIKVSEYFREVGPFIDRIWNDVTFRDCFFNGLERNESFLYKMAKEIFSFDDTLLMNAVRPWHGIHLGITRGNSNIDLAVIEENSSLTLAEIRDKLVSYSNDGVFLEIQRLVFLRELQVILGHLSISYPLKWRIQGFVYSVRKYYMLYRRAFVKLIR